MSRILITSALPYINGIKHLGNLVGSMLPADVYARFRRQLGDEVLYICATDEHGTPAELAALAAGQSVQAYCDEQHQVQAKAGEQFVLSFDHFCRTSRPETHELTQHFADKLAENGFLEERRDKQIFSITDDRFLPDRYVEGTCPACDCEKARGDQCDNCGRLLDPTELIDPYSAVSGSSAVELRETRHLYLLQAKLQPQVEAWVESHANDWPSLTLSIARKWLKEGLRDRAITRDLKWGIPVNQPGMEGKVFYVWFDAPVGYIGATKEKYDNWESWWREDKGADDVTYVEFMGKDNVAFHTVSFPCTIIGSGEPWKKVDVLKSLNWLTWYGGKFSTSENRGIFMDQALELLPADYWRWYLMANAPESDDTSFTLEGFAQIVNKDLADVLGNFVNRVTRFCKSKFGEEVPAGGENGPVEEKLFAEIDTRLRAYTEHLHAMEFRKSCAELRAIWAAGNEYMQEAAPWTAFKEDPEKAAVSVRIGLNLIRLFGVLSQPVVPFTSGKLQAIFGSDDTAWPTGKAADILASLQPGTKFTAPDVLFKKIEDTQVESWKQQFGAS